MKLTVWGRRLTKRHHAKPIYSTSKPNFGKDERVLSAICKKGRALRLSKTLDDPAQIAKGERPSAPEIAPSTSADLLLELAQVQLVVRLGHAQLRVHVPPRAETAPLGVAHRAHAQSWLLVIFFQSLLHTTCTILNHFSNFQQEVELQSVWQELLPSVVPAFTYLASVEDAASLGCVEHTTAGKREGGEPSGPRTRHLDFWE